MANKNIKVLMIEFSEIKFDARVFRSANSIGKFGFDVTLIMFSEFINKKETKKNEYFTSIVYPFHYKKDNKLLKITKAVILILKMWKDVLNTKAQVVHAHNLYFLIPTYIHHLIYNSKFIYDAHELHSKHHNESTYKGAFLNKVNYFYERFFIRKAEYIIQASDERADYITKVFDVPKPIVINNFVYLEDIKKSKYYQEKFKIGKESKIILYSGGIYGGGSRRIDKVLDALALLDSQNVFFVIVGFMNDLVKKKILSQINNLGIAERVKILPPVNSNEVVKFASFSDIGIIPLSGESLNTRFSALNKLSEYMMAGIPIACTNYDNLNRIIYKNNIGPIGETFNIKSPISIKESIENILNNQSMLAANSRKLAVDFFNWENEELKLKKLYESFCE